MNRPVSILIFLFSISALFAQKQANNWTFGKYCGLNFSTEPPTFIENIQLNSPEGCASISDQDGNLLFYSDGTTVWNKNNQTMANGTNLYGNNSSTQSAVIAPLPGSDIIYYLFTVDAQAGQFGFRYSIIDMSKQGGLGEVTAKNVFICDTVTEKVTAVKHNNGKDIWILIHQWNSDAFNSYLLNSSGFNFEPVISNTGMVHTGDIMNTSGYMKASPRGNKLALAIYYDSTVELFDFNNVSGRITNPVTFSDQKYSRPYGIEFSPDGSKLYFTCLDVPSAVYQADLLAGSPSSIISSVKTVKAYSQSNYFGALQAAPDGRIYIARYFHSALAVIGNPNENAANSGYIDDYVSLNGKNSIGGLPCFIQTYFKLDSLNLTSNSPVCEGEILILTCTRIPGAKYDWSGPAGFIDSSFEVTIPNAKRANSGTYICKVTFADGKVTTLTIDITVFSKPESRIFITGKTDFCDGDSCLLTSALSDSGITYFWDGYNKDSILVKTTGTYTLIAQSKNGCTDSSSIVINVIPKITASINSDKPMNACEGDTLRLTCNPNRPDYHYKWSTGETTSKIIVSSTSDYSVTVENSSGCSDSVKARIIFNKLPDFNIIPSNDIIVCDGDSIEIFPDKKFNIYLWSTGETTENIYVRHSGTYYLTVRDENGCSSTKSFTVSVKSIVLSKPDSLNFDKTCVGKYAERTLLLQNGGPDTVVVSQLYFSDSQSFTPIITGLPIIVPPFRSIEITIRFNPQTSKIYTDTLTFVTSSPCPKKFSVYLNGIAAGSIIAWLPDSTFKPDGKKVSIPVYAKNNIKGASPVYLSFDLTLSFYFKAFYPDGNQSVSDKIEGSQRIIEYSGNNVPVYDFDTKIAELTGIPLYSDSLNSKIKITSFISQNNEICLDTTLGSLQISKLCMQKLYEVSLFEYPSVKLTPNPASDVLKINLNNFGAKQGSIKLYNLNGEKVKSLDFNFPNIDKEYEINISTEELNSGFYELEVSSSFGLLREKVFVIK